MTNINTTRPTGDVIPEGLVGEPVNTIGSGRFPPTTAGMTNSETTPAGMTSTGMTTDDDSFILNTLGNIASLIAGAALPLAAVKFFSKDGGSKPERRLESDYDIERKHHIIVTEANRVIDDILRGKSVQVDLEGLAKTLKNNAVWFKNLVDTSIVDTDNFRLFAENIGTIASMHGARARTMALQGDKTQALLAVQAQFDTLESVKDKAMELAKAERGELMTEYITSYLKGLMVIRKIVVECDLKDIASEMAMANALREATAIAEDLISIQIARLNERTNAKQVVRGTVNFGVALSLKAEDFPGSDYYESASRVVDAISKAGPVPDTLQTKTEELRDAMERYIFMRNTALPNEEPLVLQEPVLALPPQPEGNDDTTLPDYEREAQSEFTKKGTKDFVPFYLHTMLEGWLDVLEFRVNSGIVTADEAKRQLGEIVKMGGTYKEWEEITRSAEQVLATINQENTTGQLMLDFEREAPIGPMPTELLIAEAEAALNRASVLEAIGYPLQTLIRELEREVAKIADEKQEIAVWRLLARLNWEVGNTLKRREAMLNYLHKVHEFYSPALRIAEGVRDPETMTPEERTSIGNAIVHIGEALKEFTNEATRFDMQKAPELFATASKLQIAHDKMRNFLGPVPLSVEVDMRKISPEEANVLGRNVQAKALMRTGDFREAADRFIQLADVMARSDHSLLDMGMARHQAAEALEAAGDKTAAKVQFVLAELDMARFCYDHGNYGQSAEILLQVSKSILTDPINLNYFRDRVIFRFKDTVSTWFHSMVLRYKLSAISDIDLRVTLENIAAKMGEFGWESGRNEVLKNDALKEARARLAASLRDDAAGGGKNLPELIARGDRADAPGVERPEGPKPKGRVVRALEWAKRLRRGRGR